MSVLIGIYWAVALGARPPCPSSFLLSPADSAGPVADPESCDVAKPTTGFLFATPVGHARDSCGSDCLRGGKPRSTRI